MGQEEALTGQMVASTGKLVVAHPENWVRGHFFQISMFEPLECISRNLKISFALIWNCSLEKKMVKGPKNRFEGCR